MCNLGEDIARKYYATGYAIGLEEGIAEGETVMTNLLSRMIDAGRVNDILRVLRDRV